MGKYWVGFTYDMDLLGNSLMGFIVIYCDVLRGSLWSPGSGEGLFARLWEHAYPAGGYSSMKKSRQKIFRPSW